MARGWVELLAVSGCVRGPLYGPLDIRANGRRAIVEQHGGYWRWLGFMSPRARLWETRGIGDDFVEALCAAIKWLHERREA